MACLIVSVGTLVVSGCGGPSSGPVDAKPAAQQAAGRTSCTSVAHIGDSTSVGLASEKVLPRAEDRIDAQYQRVGAKDVKLDIEGARSIIETPKNALVNGQEAAKNLLGKGFDGCFALALGTNEGANAAVGGVGMDERIDRMMKIVGDRPTLWVNVKTQVSKGPYANEHAQKWNAALEKAAKKYPNMRIYDWASVVQDSWFSKDHIHFTSDGYKQRAALIANALAKAFPQDSKPPVSAVVR